MPNYPYAIWLVAAVAVAWLWIGPFQPSLNASFSEWGLVGEQNAEEEIVEMEERNTALPSFPLYYSFGKDLPEQASALNALATELGDKYEEGKVLEITGSYFTNENSKEDENIGLSRAAALKALLVEKLGADALIERAKPLDATVENDDRLNDNDIIMIEMLSVNWIEASKTEKESVEELADRVVIRFPYNSTEKIEDPAVDEYLEKLSNRIIESGERISLMGHTDAKGTNESNQVLGMNRAKAIYSILIEKGVSTEQIDVNSMGERQPVASNESEKGKKENRRVELKILENK